MERIAPYLAGYGITRISKQTSLDTIGIPVFASFRPNALTLATNQGKGVTDQAAKASAAMEAIEFAVAERPECDVLFSSAVDLDSRGLNTYRAVSTFPAGTLFPEKKILAWAHGKNISTDESYLVPLDVVRFSGSAGDLPGICQHTNGLASGNSPEEALLHGLCELVERDAGTLWAIAPPDLRAARQIRPTAFDDPIIFELTAKIEAAGFSLVLFDQTSDVGIPTILAEIWPTGSGFLSHFDISSGSGAHPIPIRAAIRAITEAAQSRVTAIASARDDIDPAAYRSLIDPGLVRTVEPRAVSTPRGLVLGTPLAELTKFVVNQLCKAGVRNILCVPLGGDKAGVSVVKVIAEDLEDWGVNLNWRPGQRAISSLAGKL